MNNAYSCENYNKFAETASKVCREIQRLLWTLFTTMKTIETDLLVLLGHQPLWHISRIRYLLLFGAKLAPPLIFEETKIVKKSIVRIFQSYPSVVSSADECRQWIFQQDLAPTHKGKTTQEWCNVCFSCCITSEE